MYKPTLKDMTLRVSNRIAGGLPIPRPRYITNVAGAPDVDHYLRSGKDSLQAIRDMLTGNGFDPNALGDVLDFGCGSGRVLRHWAPSRRFRLHGTDYNPRLIAWCRRNYPFAEFRCNELGGELPYAHASFDFIYAWSVFTHLSEALGDHWIVELARGLRRGGVLFATFHGNLYAEWLSRPELEQFREGDVIVHRGSEAGTNTCATFHAPAAVRRKFEPRFEIIDFRAGAPPFRGQDQYLLRKHSDP